MLGFWSKGVEMTEKVAEVMRSSWNGAGDGREEGVVVEMGKRFSLVTLDIIGFSDFGYEFRALESASIGGSSNVGEKSGFELADAYNTIFCSLFHLHTFQHLQHGWSIPDRSDAIHDVSLPPCTIPPTRVNPRRRGIYQMCD